MAIFSHTNSDGGDSMDVYALDDGIIEFHTAVDSGRGSGCRIPKEDALRLYAALGEALYPAHTPEAQNRSLIAQLIERAVADQVAAVLPLHLAPTGDRWGYTDANQPQWATQDKSGLCADCGDTRPALALYHACTADTPDRVFDNQDAPELCRIVGCMATGMPGTHFAHAPKPQSACATAGEHRPQDCPEYPDVRPATLWEAELRRDAGRSLSTPYCHPCGHSWQRHNVLGCGIRECKCTQERP